MRKDGIKSPPYGDQNLLPPGEREKARDLATEDNYRSMNMAKNRSSRVDI